MSCISESEEDPFKCKPDLNLRDHVREIISDFIELPLQELTHTESSLVAPQLSERVDPPFTPTTFTLWRRVALKKLRQKLHP